MIQYGTGVSNKYRLTHSYDVLTDLTGFSVQHPYFAITPSGVVTIERGYEWDGPSGPAIDTENFMRGSLVHDMLYQCISMGLLPLSCRAAADKLLHKLITEDGMFWLRTYWVYAGVRLFGGFYIKRK